MKTGIFIYQAPPIFGRNTIVEPEVLTSFWSVFSKPTKSTKFLDKLNEKLESSGYPVTVVKDKTEANLEEIAAQNYDFIICTPGLQKRVVASDELPAIIYLESLEYHNTSVDPTIDKIKEEILND